MSTFVSVGNATQPFERLLIGVADIASLLPQPVVVQHGSTPFVGGEGCIAKAFVDMEEFEQLIGQADLLIFHAGAGSVIHAIRAGKVPVVMPRTAKHGELIDEHQAEFALALEQEGKVVMVEDPANLEAAVAEAIQRQKANDTNTSSSTMVGLVDALLQKLAGNTGK